MHNILLCNSDKSLTDKTFKCESYVSDNDITEDPEALVNEDKRTKASAENKHPGKQMEVLKNLSLKQQMEAERKEFNDRVAFLQSGRVEDRVMRVCEERYYLSGESRSESEINSPSN